MNSKIRKNIVLLAGGIGKRLWPLSKKLYPKQFISIPNLNLSTFQLAIKNSLEIAEIKDIIITANKEHQALLRNQISALGLYIDDFTVILEDHNINTAKAIYNSCLFILDKKENDNLTYFFPTDHVILESRDIFKNILKKIDVNKINLFGELVSNMCSNFGYMIADKNLSEQYYTISKFIEKPSKDRCMSYMKLGII